MKSREGKKGKGGEGRSGQLRVKVWGWEGTGRGTRMNKLLAGQGEEHENGGPLRTSWHGAPQSVNPALIASLQ